ncbi:MAG: hypothetical protein LKJ88_04720 [Bacilli bacterium]|jgi:hypothetical protein|nr:hypothetical protein [Bacilli bacterium]
MGLEELLASKILPKEEEERIKKELIEELNKDEELPSLLKSLGGDEKAFERSLSVLARYETDKKVCCGCTGFDKCQKENGRKGLKRKLVYMPYEQAYEDLLYPCPYFKKIQDTLSDFVYADVNPLNSYQISQELKKSLNKSVLSSVKTSFSAVADQVFKILTAFKEGKETKGLYIYGPNNNPYFLLLGMAYFFARNGFKVSLVDAKKTLEMANSKDEQMKKDTLADLAKAQKADVCFVFNLGGEIAPLYFASNVLLPFLTERNKKGNLTFITSMLSFNELIAYYFKDETRRKSLGKLLSQLVEEASIVEPSRF